MAMITFVGLLCIVFFLLMVALLYVYMFVVGGIGCVMCGLVFNWMSLCFGFMYKFVYMCILFIFCVFCFVFCILCAFVVG